jgi:hypothetical protein
MENETDNKWQGKTYLGVLYCLKRAGKKGVRVDEIANYIHKTERAVLFEIDRVTHIQWFKKWIEFNPSTRRYTLHKEIRKAPLTTLGFMVNEFFRADERAGVAPDGTNVIARENPKNEVIHSIYDEFKNNIDRYLKC